MDERDQQIRQGRNQAAIKRLTKELEEKQGAIEELLQTIKDQDAAKSVEVVGAHMVSNAIRQGSREIALAIRETAAMQ